VDVAVDDAGLVQGVEGVEELGGDDADPTDRQRTVLADRLGHPAGHRGVQYSSHAFRASSSPGVLS
jgi:hypothetical protein